MCASSKSLLHQSPHTMPSRTSTKSKASTTMDDPFATDHPDNKSCSDEIRDTLDERMSQFKFANGDHGKQRIKTEETIKNTTNQHSSPSNLPNDRGLHEWQGHQYRRLKGAGYTLTFSTLHNRQLMHARIDHVELKKRKRQDSQFVDIWLCFSLQTRGMMEINIYNAKECKLKEDRAIFTIKGHDVSHRDESYHVTNQSFLKCRLQTSNKLKYLLKDDPLQDLQVIIKYEANLTEFFQFIRYLHSTKPGSRHIPECFKTLSFDSDTANGTPMKKKVSYRSSYNSKNSKGFNPTLSSSVQRGLNRKRSSLSNGSSSIKPRNRNNRSNQVNRRKSTGSNLHSKSQSFSIDHRMDNNDENDDNVVQDVGAGESGEYSAYLDCKHSDISKLNGNTYPDMKHTSQAQGSRRRGNRMVNAAADQRNGTNAAGNASKAAQQRIDAMMRDNKSAFALQTAHYQNKKQSKAANRTQRGKSNGGFMDRINRGRRIYDERTRKNSHTVSRRAGSNPLHHNTSSHKWQSKLSLNQYGVLSTVFSSGRTGKQIGFRNLGNTCYLNAILRSITSLDSLSRDFRRKWLLQMESVYIRSKSSLYRAYLDLMLEDLRNMEIIKMVQNEEKHKNGICKSTKRGRVLEPWILKKLIGDKESMFSSHRQQDAHELLSTLLNALHDEVYNAVREVHGNGMGDERVKKEDGAVNTQESSEDDDHEMVETQDIANGSKHESNGVMKMEVDSNHNHESNGHRSGQCADENQDDESKDELEWLSPIHSNFHFQIEFQYECTKCRFKRNKVESFREMSLDLPLKNKSKSPKPSKRETNTKSKVTFHDETQHESDMKEGQIHDIGDIDGDRDMKEMEDNKEDVEREEKAEIAEQPDPSRTTRTAQTTPSDTWQKFKDQLLGKHEEGCPSHGKGEHLTFQTVGSSWDGIKFILKCSKCADAQLGVMDIPRESPLFGKKYPVPKQPSMSTNHWQHQQSVPSQRHIVNEWTLEELLRAYFVRKRLEYKCGRPDCDGMEVEVSSWFTQIPRVLVLHIKRFIPNYLTNSYRKSHDKVQIDKTLDIHLFCNETLSLPPSSLDDVDSISNGNGSKSKNTQSEADGVYSKRNLDRVICTKREELPSEMQVPFKRSDYETSTTTTTSVSNGVNAANGTLPKDSNGVTSAGNPGKEEDDDGDLEIMNGNNKENVNPMNSINRVNQQNLRSNRVSTKYNRPSTPPTPPSNSSSANPPDPNGVNGQMNGHFDMGTDSNIPPEIPSTPTIECEPKPKPLSSAGKLVQEFADKYGVPPEDPPLRRALSFSTTEPGASEAKDEESDEEPPDDMWTIEEGEFHAAIWNNIDANWRTEWSKERCESVLLGSSLMNQGNAITETAAMYLKYWKSKEWYERHQQCDETQNGAHNGTDDADPDRELEGGFIREHEGLTNRKRKRDAIEGGHDDDIEVLPPSKRRKNGTPNAPNHSNKSDVVNLELNTNCNSDWNTNSDSRSEEKESVDLKSSGLNDSIQTKITDYVGDGARALSSGNPSKNGQSTDQDAELAKALSLSMETAKMDEIHRTQSGFNLESEDAELQRAIAMSMGQDVDEMAANGTRNGKEEESKNGEILSPIHSAQKVSNGNDFKAVCNEKVLAKRKGILTEYRLRSVVRHLGSSYMSGHYVTDVLSGGDAKGDGTEKDEWERHDDQYVKTISDTKATDDTAQKNAYIFFYVRQDKANTQKSHEQNGQIT